LVLQIFSKQNSRVYHSPIQVRHLSKEKYFQYRESKEVVESFLSALNTDEFKLARSYLEDTIMFQGPLGKRGSADEYMKYMEKLRLKYEMMRVFSDTE
ncbi:MAG TPA: hypothetical protein VJN71_01565, partial [Nitrososphaerales archaeon]|nr:hypothetical protein [Nitrososphaerales archaeon]